MSLKQRTFLKVLACIVVIWSSYLPGKMFDYTYLTTPSNAYIELATAINDRGSAAVTSIQFDTGALKVESIQYLWSSKSGFKKIRDDSMFIFPAKINNHNQLAAMRFDWESQVAGFLFIFDPLLGYIDFERPKKQRNGQFQNVPGAAILPFQAFNFEHARAFAAIGSVLGFNNQAHLLLKSVLTREPQYLFWNGLQFELIKGVDEVYKINDHDEILARKGKTIVVLSKKNKISKLFKMSGATITGFNNQGQIIGIQQGSKKAEFLGFLWDPNNGLIILDFLPLAMNNLGKILGARLTPQGEPYFYDLVQILHGNHNKSLMLEMFAYNSSEWILWEEGKSKNIKVPLLQERLFFLHDINDEGSIVGETENFRAILLTPSL